MGCVLCIEYRLNRTTKETTKELTLKDTIFSAKVLDVYDGDTITISFFLGSSIYKKNLRINNLDTPEIRTKNIEEKTKGLEARDYLKKMILNKIVKIDCKGWDKYGRILGNVSYDKIDISEHMISKGYGYAYDGGKKIKMI